MEEDWFAAPVATLAAPLLDRFAKELHAVDGLAAPERAVVREAATRSVLALLQVKLNRVFLLELQAASLEGRLGDGEPPERWQQFLTLARTPDYLAELAGRYPVLHERTDAVAARHLDAVLELAARLASDRPALAALLDGREPGPLQGLSLGAGDPHRGGHAVALLDFAHGRVVYKPRPTEVDAALAAFLEEVGTADGAGPALRVPRTLVRAGYGWAGFVTHRYCRDSAELALFYRALGRWLAVMRLLGGTDLHAENLIACGPEPVVVDAETLFTPDPPTPPSGRGEAVDLAYRLIRGTVLRTGILPLRADGYTLAGVDISAAGSLPGQNPRIRVPVIADAGTDAARLAVDVVDLPRTGNHPSPDPVLIHHWDQVVAGFRDQTAHLAALDAAGALAPALDHFHGTVVRLLRRPTQAYVEIARMLWHPASLHDPAAALERGRDIMRRNAAALPGAPDDPATVDAEIADLLLGDIPVFTFTVDRTRLDATLADWHSADLWREEDVIRSALVGAYLNERQLPARVQVPTRKPHGARLDARRRRIAADAVERLLRHAVTGVDGTTTWISPVLMRAGWAIRPLTADLYSGQGGVVLALAQYRAEARAGRADEVPGLEPALRGALRVLAATEERVPTAELGGFLGLAGQAWTWAALHGLADDPVVRAADPLERARARAALITAEALAADQELDVLTGTAGVIVPLLGLTELTGEDQWLAAAAAAGAQLERTVRHDERGARWSTPLTPEGIGGFAHGSTGIGWALSRLAASPAGSAADRARWCALAGQAFAFESSLFDDTAGAWQDARVGSQTDFPTAWCHGSTGIGLAAADLYRRGGDAHQLETARRSLPATMREGFGWSHTLCHGDLGLRELLATLAELLPDYAGPDLVWADAELLSGIEERGPVGGIAKEAFAPGLMPGLAGVVTALLRMHPDHRVVSPLLQDLTVPTR
ncbi:type 2 lantipeptide synthetase LanM [Streptacidiphilus pinicola]|uniref:Type 2 lantipeptide synthetase LanM n=1 Tax=Streptacidiphilus pinicola TaxID=2219663 RepID=A0A2X0KDF2_9ACTN|nr:type 2 lanthipeptide synthetase LanM family protein [Streptacidiphilus pinicola]RAG85219.1 type 2 lantipeptide synthetase LanM [Streptacidiphilus pinicola]